MDEREGGEHGKQGNARHKSAEAADGRQSQAPLLSLSSLLRHHWRQASASSFTFLRGQCYAAAATANPLCKLIFGHIQTFVHHVREG